MTIPDIWRRLRRHIYKGYKSTCKSCKVYFDGFGIETLETCRILCFGSLLVEFEFFIEVKSLFCLECCYRRRKHKGFYAIRVLILNIIKVVVEPACRCTVEELIVRLAIFDNKLPCIHGGNWGLSIRMQAAKY